MHPHLRENKPSATRAKDLPGNKGCFVAPCSAPFSKCTQMASIRGDKAHAIEPIR
jgi:hypothetical protein